MGLLVRAVLTLDVVNFSMIKPDQKQLEVIQALIQMLRDAIPKEYNHPNAWIWSPAGDGGSLTFLEDNNAALETAIALGKLVKAYNKRKDIQPFELRMGIHLGTVSKETDFDDRVNVWGEGVNISARVAGLAQPGQILISEDYYKATALETRPAGEVTNIGKWWAKHHKPLVLYNIYRDGIGISPSDVEEWYGPFHYPLQQAIDMYEAMMQEQKFVTDQGFRAAVLCKRLLDLAPEHKQAEQVLTYLSTRTWPFTPNRLYDRFFSDLSPTAIVYFFRNAKFGDFKKSDTIFKMGEPADSLMMVVSGEVVLYIGKEIVLSEGSIIGEMGLFNPGETRSATLTANKSTITLTLNYDFLKVPENVPDSVEMQLRREIRARIWKYYCERKIQNTINLHPLFQNLPDDERNKLMQVSEFLPAEHGQLAQLDPNEAWNSWTLVVDGEVQVHCLGGAQVVYRTNECLGPMHLAEKDNPFASIQVADNTQLITMPWNTIRALISSQRYEAFRKDCIFAGHEDRSRLGLI